MVCMGGLGQDASSRFIEELKPKALKTLNLDRAGFRLGLWFRASFKRFGLGLRV